MSTRTRPFRGLLFAVMLPLLLAPAAGADDTAADSGTPSANDPLDLSRPAAPPLAPPPAPTAETASPPVVAGEGTAPPEDGETAPAGAAPIEPATGSAAEDATAAGESTLPPSERKALGVPARAGSPEPAAGAGPPPAEGVLGRLGLPDNELLRIGGALAVVLGLLLLTRVVLKRAAGALGGGSRPAGVLEVLARYPIARGQTLVVLKLARRVVLAHHAGSSMRTLTEVTDPDEVAQLLGRMEAGSRGSESARFAAALRSFEGEHERLSRRGAADERRRPDAVEIVDLTRSQGRGLGGLLGRRRLTA